MTPDEFTRVSYLEELIKEAHLHLFEVQAVQRLTSKQDELVREALTERGELPRYHLYHQRTLEWEAWALQAQNAHRANVAILTDRLNALMREE